MQNYSKKELAEQGKIQTYSVRRKGAPGSVMEPKSSAQGDDTLKKNMTLNGIKRVVTSGQDSIQLSFQLMKQN